MTNSIWEAVVAVGSMASLDVGLKQSGCSHLQAFLRDTLRFWHKIIKDRLAGYVCMGQTGQAVCCVSVPGRSRRTGEGELCVSY